MVGKIQNPHTSYKNWREIRVDNRADPRFTLDGFFSFGQLALHHAQFK